MDGWMDGYTTNKRLNRIGEKAAAVCEKPPLEYLRSAWSMASTAVSCPGKARKEISFRSLVTSESIILI